MMRPWRVATAVALSLSVSPAAADDREAAAERAFREGRRLFDSGRIAEACARFARSAELDEASGALLNLAVCRERQGRLASAHRAYGRARFAAEREGRDDRARLAARRSEALEPRLSQLVLRTPAAGLAEGLRVELDGEPVGNRRFDGPIAVDPGEHELTFVTGAGEQKRRFRISAEAERVVIELPAPPPEVSQPKQPPEPRRARPALAPVPERTHDGGWSERDSMGVGGVALGGVALGLSGFFALRALDLRGQSDEECLGGACSQRGVELNDDARRHGNYATVSLLAGAVLIGLGAYLLLADEPERGTARWQEGVRW